MIACLRMFVVFFILFLRPKVSGSESRARVPVLVQVGLDSAQFRRQSRLNKKQPLCSLKARVGPARSWVRNRNFCFRTRERDASRRCSVKEATSSPTSTTTSNEATSSTRPRTRRTRHRDRDIALGICNRDELGGCNMMSQACFIVYIAHYDETHGRGDIPEHRHAGQIGMPTTDQACIQRGARGQGQDRVE